MQFISLNNCAIRLIAVAVSLRQYKINCCNKYPKWIKRLMWWTFFSDVSAGGFFKLRRRLIGIFLKEAAKVMRIFKT